MSEERHSDDAKEEEQDGKKEKEVDYVHKLKKELSSTKKKLKKALEKLSKVERKLEKSHNKNKDLRKDVKKLSRELHAYKRAGRKTYSIGVQVGETLSLSLDNGVTDGVDSGAVQYEESQDTHVTSQAVQAVKEPSPLSLADSLKATAQAAIEQTGFVFDENSGLYYDYNTGYYYDPEKSLYYDGNSGIYYYYDQEQGEYQFHSQVDISHYDDPSAAGSDYQGDHQGAALVYEGTETLRGASDQRDRRKKQKRTHSDEKPKKSKRKHKKEKAVEQEIPATNSCEKKNNEAKDAPIFEIEDGTDGTVAMETDEKNEEEGMIVDNPGGKDKNDKDEEEEEEEELEDGELSESYEGSESESESSESLSDAAPYYPPCIRVMVMEAEHLESGTLYLITCTGATIGREKNMNHAIEIPDVQVSKMHCSIKYDEESRNYLLVDHASQNGTFLNGVRLSEPKVMSAARPLLHGDELALGSSKLVCHIHPGTETCDGCEPGQVQAQMQAQAKEESCVQLLSKGDKDKLRKQHLAMIRKKYGLKSAPYVDNKAAIDNPDYKDKAEERRKTKGSDNPYQKDDAPASVDRAISSENKGHKLMLKMGWKAGNTLGKSQAGLKEPIKVNIRTKPAAGLGLGMVYERSMDDVMTKDTNQKWIKAQERFGKIGHIPKKRTAVPTHQWQKGETLQPEVGDPESHTEVKPEGHSEVKSEGRIEVKSEKDEG